MPPRLSVVIPTRDCLAYLPAAIASVRAQALGPVEIVVVDDGSRDGTGDWLAGAARSDPLLRPVAGPARGVAAARNRGIASASAEIIAFLDADDQYLPGALDDRLPLMESDPAITLTFADVMSVTPDGALVGHQFAYWPLFRDFLAGRSGLLPLGPDAFAMLLAEMVCGTSSVATRKSALAAVGGFDERYRISEDWDLWLKLARHGPVWCSTRRATRYLVRPGSTSRDMGELARTMRAVFDAQVPDPAAIPQPWRGVAQARVRVAEAEAAMIAGRHREAMLGHLAAFRVAPSKVLAKKAAADLLRLLRLK
ncbi:glycosyltransferase [Aquabacter spiritensis]|uniref:Glycosyl transferase family 2 n=1 Tax=Aquabacter spiritensis TaxID=933073 RepID=A0A4V2UY48_9HYPH|nr:glycosyltransferase [Aquabacter spiritensis]TCT06018.1 glycosyl transferase family 2 [Aquabacter spiritensis]